MVITLYPGQAAEEVEKQVTIPVERALTGVPQRAGPAVDHVVRPVAGDPDLRGRRRHLLRAPAGRRAAARRRGARRRRRRTLGPERHAGRAGLPVHARERPPHAERAAQLAGLGGLEAPDARARRRRRGQLRRLPEGVPRARRPGAPARQRPHAEGPDRRGRGVERRDVGRLPALRRERVRRARPRLPAQRRATSRTRSSRAQNGTPVLVRNVAKVVEALHAAARRGRARRRASTRSRGRSCCGAARTRKDVLDGVHEAVDAHQPRRPAARACRSCRSTTARAWSTPRCTRSSHNMLEGAVLVSAGAVAVPARALAARSRSRSRCRWRC